MSFWHKAYLFDFAKYERLIDGRRRDPAKLAEWREPMEALRARYRARGMKSLPRWKRDFFYLRESRIDALVASKNPLRTMEQVRDLHYAGLVECCVSRVPGLEYWSHLLETALNRFLGDQAGKRMVLGKFESGTAWNFEDGWINYSCGFADPAEVRWALRSLKAVTRSKLRGTLRSLNCKEVYPMYADRKPDEEEEAFGIRALQTLKSSLEEARSRKLGLVYILD